MTGADGDLVSIRRTYVFAADGATLTSEGIRRYPPRAVIEESLILLSGHGQQRELGPGRSADRLTASTGRGSLIAGQAARELGSVSRQL